MTGTYGTSGGGGGEKCFKFSVYGRRQMVEVSEVAWNRRAFVIEGHPLRSSPILLGKG